MEREEARKGPWTEQEDVQLAFYVNLFGDRRWDFIAKVSGLKVGGRQDRYRWSRIARKLPGRTDNEIKNYWRTLMRKKAQEKNKKGKASSSSSSSLSSSSSTSSSSVSARPEVAPERGFYDTGGADLVSRSPGEKKSGVEVEESEKVDSMDDIWKEFEFSEGNCRIGGACEGVGSPIWDYCPNDSLWCMDEEEESKMLMQLPIGHDHFQSFPFNNYII